MRRRNRTRQGEKSLDRVMIRMEHGSKLRHRDDEFQCCLTGCSADVPGNAQTCHAVRHLRSSARRSGPGGRMSESAAIQILLLSLNVNRRHIAHSPGSSRAAVVSPAVAGDNVLRNACLLDGGVKGIGGHDGQKQQGCRARTRRAARLQGRQAPEGPLVGGAPSAGRAGVHDGLQARGAVEVVGRLAA
jgi:hypothetical protein